jgi:hypothetical protein
MAEQEKKDTFTVEYGQENAVPTTYPYLAGGQLRKEDRDKAAKALGVKESESDFVVVSDDIGRKLTVKAIPKK